MSTQAKPILMNGAMVRAILDGRKLQTRRVIKPQPRCTGTSNLDRIEYSEYFQGWMPTSPSGKIGIFEPWKYNCPFGVSGNRLWVRETWRIMGLLYEEEPCIQYKAGLAEQSCYVPDDWLDMRWEDWYERQSAKLVEDCEKAGLKPNNDYDELYRWERDTCPTRWQPSIHMPKFAARIWLEVVSVRAERLQEISEQDIIAEGIQPDMVDSGALDPNGGWGIDVADYHHPFMALWDNLNAKRGHPWSANDWVWVVSFNQLSRPT